eukprot:2713806-Pyramimonas_sp.AAC.1
MHFEGFVAGVERMNGLFIATHLIARPGVALAQQLNMLKTFPKECPAGVPRPPPPRQRIHGECQHVRGKGDLQWCCAEWQRVAG